MRLLLRVEAEPRGGLEKGVAASSLVPFQVVAGSRRGRVGDGGRRVGAERLLLVGA